MKGREKFLRMKSAVVMLGIFALVGFAHQPVVAQECQDYLTITEEGGIYTINLNNIPNDVASFGFDLVYNETELTYVNYSISGCPSWDFFMVNPKPCEEGICEIRLGGFAVNSLPAGTTDCLVRLEFTKEDPSGPAPQMCILNLVDNMAGWCDGCGNDDCPDCCCGPEIREICDDGIDNNNDGLTDCEDIEFCDGQACNDGNLCTEGDTCAAGVCSGTEKDCSGLDDQCNIGTCDPETGNCVQDPEPKNGEPCDDGNPGTGGDTCIDGACIGEGIDEICDDGIDNNNDGLTDCEDIEFCDGQACNDGNLCTEGDTCAAGVCSGTEKDCSGLDDQCNIGTCDPETGNCVQDPEPKNGEPCDDGNPGTGGDTCIDGACIGEAIMECTPGETRGCDTGIPGVCAAGTQTCDQGGTWGPCEQDVQPSAEVCDDGLDNDCDGLVDCADPDCEGFVIEPTECGTGVCSSTGELICSGGEQVDTCEPGMPTEEPETTCDDGLDNDCDGLVDCDDPDCDCVKKVYFDIKPGSCPNSFNTKSKGVLPVALLGSAAFDVTTIDTETLRVTREGVTGSVTPTKNSYEDVGTPFEGELCDCHDLTGDGYVDLTLKLDSEELVNVLMLDQVQGETIPLIITGNLKASAHSSPITGEDCIRVLTDSPPPPPPPDPGKCTQDEDCGFCKKCVEGQCVFQTDEEDLKDECPDDVCKTGFCNGAGGCGYEPDGTECDDDLFCTETDVCLNGSCEGSDSPCAPGAECDEINDICLTEPPLCAITIEPYNPSVGSGQSLSFSATATGSCEAPDYAWSIASNIGSIIDQSGNYIAGINTDCSEDAVDVIEVEDRNNGVFAEVEVAVYCQDIITVYPDVLWSSRWLRIPVLMFVVSQRNDFIPTSELTFEPAGNITPVWSFGFGNVLFAIVVVETNAQVGPYSATITSGSTVISKQDALEMIMLPLPLKD